VRCGVRRSLRSPRVFFEPPLFVSSFRPFSSTTVHEPMSDTFGGLIIDVISAPGRCRRFDRCIDAERFPRERLLKNPLTQVACEKETIRAARPESSEESQLRNADVLGLIHYRKFKRRMRDSSNLQRHPAEHIRVSDQISGRERGPNAFKNRPQHDSLSFL